MARITKQTLGEVRDGLVKYTEDGTWHISIRVNGKKWQRDTGEESRTMAAEWRDAFRKQLSRQEVGIAKKKECTLDEALTAWASAERGSRTDKHIEDRCDCIRRHLAPSLTLPIESLTTGAMDEYRSAYLSGTWRGPTWTEGRSLPRTLGGWNRIQRHLLSLCRWAAARGLARGVPFTPTKLKQQEEPKSVIWPEQVPAFLEAIQSARSRHAMTAIRLMLQLGLREDEALTSRWEWLDRGGSCYWTGDSKDRSARQIDLPPGFLDYLDKYHPARTSGLILVGRIDAVGNEHPHDKGFTSRLVRKGAQKVGIQGMTPHRIRATFATAHWEAGTSIADLMELLGHGAPSTTMKYVVQRGRSRKEAQARVSEIMGISPSGVPI